jgi:hypothetical protein
LLMCPSQSLMSGTEPELNKESLELGRLFPKQFSTPCNMGTKKIVGQDNE